VEWFSQVLITYQLYQPMVQATGNQLVDGLIILSGIELENLSSHEPNAFCTKQKKGNSSASGIWNHQAFCDLIPLIHSPCKTKKRRGHVWIRH
jgi:hypothetical protein